MILLDSSHEYVATVREIELWYPALQTDGLFLAPRCGLFDEWRRKNPQAEAICLNGESRTMDLPRPLYKDACGLGLIQKAGLLAPTRNDAGSMRRP